MSSSLLLLLRNHSKPSPSSSSSSSLLIPKLLPVLTFLRPMGGGPRTFKGGLSKWQYKRMHEKLAKEKERKLLNQEKQLYQARLRSEIRARAAAGGKAPPPYQPSDHPSVGPMTSTDHIKALADRFMKAGAEDLWNDDDGPVHSRPVRDRERPSPLDLRKIIGRPGLSAGGQQQQQQQQRREYSKWRQNESSDDSDFEMEDTGARDAKFGNALKLLRFSEEEEKKEEGAFGSGRRGRREMRTGAALGNYDVKWEKRSLMKEDPTERIREIRDEVRGWGEMRSSGGRREEVGGLDGSGLTQKR